MIGGDAAQPADTLSGVMSIGIRRSSTYAAIRPVAQHTSPSGTLLVLEPSPGLVKTMATGRLDAAMFAAYRQVADTRIKRNQLTVHAHDWEALTAYDFDVRVEMAKWLTENAPFTPAALFLAKSPLVTMAITAANLSTSEKGLALQSTTDRAEFERSIEVAVRKAQGSEPPRPGGAR